MPKYIYGGCELPGRTRASVNLSVVPMAPSQPTPNPTLNEASSASGVTPHGEELTWENESGLGNGSTPEASASPQPVQASAWAEHIPEVTTPATSSLPPIVSATDLLADQTLKLPPLLIEGLLHQGLKACLGGGSKSRKTWVMLHLALAVSKGGQFLRWRASQGRTLYINFEIPPAFLRNRLQVLAEALGLSDLDGLDVWNLRGKSAPLTALLPELIAQIGAGQYVLVIIDPIYKGLGERDENSAKDVARLCAELEIIAVETHAAVLYAGHYSKGNQAGKDALDRVSGSGVWSRDADVILTLTAHAEPNCYTVETVLRNLPEQPPFVVEWRYPLMVVRDDLDPANLKQPKPKNRPAGGTAYSEEAALALVPEEGIDKVALVRQLQKVFSVSDRTARTYVNDLVTPLPRLVNGVKKQVQLLSQKSIPRKEVYPDSPEGRKVIWLTRTAAALDL